MSILVETEKIFVKIQQPYMIKILIKPGIKGNYLNLIKSFYKNPTANIILNGEVPVRLRTRQGYLLSPHY